MEARRSARSQKRDWFHLKELYDEGHTILGASEGGSSGTAELDQGFSIERVRFTARKHYKRTQWALAVVSRYRRNLALGGPVLEYPNEPIFTRTRADMNDGDQKAMRRRVANIKTTRLRALRASRTVAQKARARKVQRHAKTNNLARRSRSRA